MTASSHSIDWRERRNRTFHLAGSLRPDDAFIHSKRGFSPLRHPVASWRVIADPEACRRLAARWERPAGSVTAPHEGVDFFPAYRAPTQAVAEEGT